MSPLSCSSFFFFFFIFFACYIVVVSVVSICLVCNFSIVATCPSIQLPALLFVCVLFLLFVDVLSGEPDFRCGALLFMVFHVIYKYKNR